MAKGPGRMQKLGDDAYKETDDQLSDREIELLLSTTFDWKAHRPEVADPETYNKLMAAVEDATRRNESIAQFRDRLKELGKEGLALAKRVVGRLPFG